MRLNFKRRHLLCKFLRACIQGRPLMSWCVGSGNASPAQRASGPGCKSASPYPPPLVLLVVLGLLEEQEQEG